MHVHPMFRIAVLASAFTLTGCAADLPTVSTDGTLIGGDERIRSILEVGRREATSRRQHTFSVVFVGEPYSNALVHGTLENGNDAHAMAYQLVVPAEGAVRSHQAVVLIPSDDVARPATSLLYRWERAAWNPLPGVTLSKSP